MKEKQFDHIENKIREAAEQHMPEFDEKNWNNMEQLLDKDKDRRRPVFWFIVPALVCAITAGYFLFANHEESASTFATNEQPVLKTVAKEKQSILENDTLLTSGKVVIDNDEVSGKKNAITTSKVNIIDAKIASNDAKRTSLVSSTENLFYNDNKDVIDRTKKITDERKGKLRAIITGGTASDDDAVVTETNEDKGATLIDMFKKENRKEQIRSLINDTIAKKNIVENKTDKPAKEKSERTASRLYFIALAGVDAGSTKLFSLNNSTTVVKYNIGVGYQLATRISVQTGLNISRKKYVAGPDDYTAKAGSYLANVNIKEVEANCLVYEIPLNIRYNILQRINTAYYATAGLSSYIMKKEDYKYHYTAGSAYYQSAWAYKGNKNFFSVGTLSLGVEKKLTSKFSLLAEPSLSIPLSGVGEGSVKLYSMAMQVGIKYQPLKKKR